MTDFSRIGDAPLFAVSTPFHFGPPTFQLAAILSMFIVMLVIMTETTADILAIGEVVDKPARRQTVTTRPAGRLLSTAVRAAFSTGSRSARSPRTSAWWPITGIKSRFVVAVGGGILVFLGLFPILGALVAPSRCPCSAAPGWRSSARWPPAASARSARSTSRATPTS